MNDKQAVTTDKPETIANARASSSDTLNSATATADDGRDKVADHQRARAVGARLTTLREDRNLVLDDISAYLKVSVAKLRALEAGDVHLLPDGAFALGLLRSYAKNLGVDPNPLVEELRAASNLFPKELSPPGVEGASLPRNHESVIWRGRLNKRRLWIAGAVALLLLICVGLYWEGDASLSPSQSNQDQTSTLNLSHPQPVSDAKEGKGASETLATALPAASVASGVAPAAMQPSAEPRTPQTSPAQPVANRLSIIHVKVSAENWVSVLQGDGKEVYTGVLAPGQERDIPGIPPFKVTVGNQAGLESMRLDGQLIDPVRYTRANQKVVHFDLP